MSHYIYIYISRFTGSVQELRRKEHCCLPQMAQKAWLIPRSNHNSRAALLSSPIYPSQFLTHIYIYTYAYPPSLLLVASSSGLRQQCMLVVAVFCQTWPPYALAFLLEFLVPVTPTLQPSPVLGNQSLCVLVSPWVPSEDRTLLRPFRIQCGCLGVCVCAPWIQWYIYI